MARGDLLALAQDAFAGGEIVVIGLGRRRHRGIGEAQHLRAIVEALPDGEGIGLFRESDRALLAGVEIADDDARQAVLALEADEIIGKQRKGDDHAARLMAHFIDPEILAGRPQRRADDFEILGAVCVGANVKPVAAMLDLITQAWRARLDQARLRVRDRKGR